MIKYVFTDIPRIKNAKLADPQKLGEALTAIKTANGGRLTKKLAVDAATDKSNALHPHIDWDDKIAAHKHRLEQAGEIIRLVGIHAEDAPEKQPAPAFLSAVDTGSRRSYHTADEVANSISLQLSILRQAERDLEAWEKRYRELVDICVKVRELREQIAQRRAEAELRTQ